MVLVSVHVLQQFGNEQNDDFLHNVRIARIDGAAHMSQSRACWQLQGTANTDLIPTCSGWEQGTKTIHLSMHHGHLESPNFRKLLGCSGSLLDDMTDKLLRLEHFDEPLASLVCRVQQMNLMVFAATMDCINAS